MKRTWFILSLVMAAALAVGSSTGVSAAGKPSVVRVTGVTVDQHSIKIVTSGTVSLTATLQTTAGTATNQKVTWTTSDKKVASVNDTGLIAVVTGVALGTASITVKTADGRFTDTCEVVVTIPISSIGEISGTATVGQMLTAGPVSPPEATVAYQWQSCPAVGGTYTDISRAIGPSFFLRVADLDLYIRVTATGTGSYSGTVTSAPTSRVAPIQLTSMGAISGVRLEGHTLTAGSLVPSEATVVYQWRKCENAEGIFVDIPGATNSGYTPIANDVDQYLQVVALGTGAYSGSIASEAVLISARELPFNEDFTGIQRLEMPLGWERNDPWCVYVEDFDWSWQHPGLKPELRIKQNDDARDFPPFVADARASTPAIDATSATSSLSLSFKHYLEIASTWSSYTIEVQVSTFDGSTWSEWAPTSFALNSPSAAVGPETVNVDLGSHKGTFVGFRTCRGCSSNPLGWSRGYSR